MDIIENLKIQNNPFKFGGIIGRKYYFVYSLLLFFIMYFTTKLFVNLNQETINWHSFALIIILFVFFSIVFISLTAKRISDIRGKRKYSLSIATLFLFFPKNVWLLLPWFYIAIKKGKIIR